MAECPKWLIALSAHRHVSRTSQHKIHSGVAVFRDRASAYAVAVDVDFYVLLANSASQVKVVIAVTRIGVLAVPTGADPGRAPPETDGSDQQRLQSPLQVA